MYGSIENTEAISRPKTANSTPRWMKLFVFVFSLSVFFVLLFSVTNNNANNSLSLLKEKTHKTKKNHTTHKDEDMFTTTDSLSFYFQRVGYDSLVFLTDRETTLTYSFLSNYSTIIEPNVEMDLIVTNSETSNFKYTVCSSDQLNECSIGVKSENFSESSYLISNCEPLTSYLITISEYDEEWNFISESTGQGICMYVRREIRSLSTEDLQRTMDAMFVLWSTKEEIGQVKYGENFHNSTYFSSAHDFNAAWQDSDHIHEGLGFLSQHLKLTNMFEKSMQAVDPSVSLFYWDYTIETASNLTAFDSPMFTNETFGDLVPAVDTEWGWLYKNDRIEDARVSTGRWSNIPADINFQYPELANGFGYIRGPWNMNPSALLTRFASYSPSLPTCLEYFAWATEVDTLDFLELAPYGPHSTAHSAIGSVYGCDLLDPLLENGIILDEESQRYICKQWGFYLKELYRGNFIKAKTDCVATTLTYEGIQCGFVCNPATSVQMSQKIESLIPSSYLSPAANPSVFETIQDFICEGDGYRIFVGDHLESASPSDPSFWPIHPTMERLVHAKMTTGALQASLFDWPTNSSSDYVCDKSTCYEAEFGVEGTFEMCCRGHYRDDQLMDFVSGNRSAGIGETNYEILMNIDPQSSSYAVPYIYDSFSWSHCSEDFDSIFLSSSTNPINNIPNNIPH